MEGWFMDGRESGWSEDCRDPINEERETTSRHRRVEGRIDGLLKIGRTFRGKSSVDGTLRE